MDDKNLEATKEINTLKDLSLEALNNLEDTFDKNSDAEEENLELPLEEFDENLADADLIFETKIETKKEVEDEIKKENIFLKLKKKWNGLEKKNRILIIVISILIVLLIIIGLFFLLHKTDSPIIKGPDVILEGDNYRYENGVLVLLEGTKELGTYECENKDKLLCEVAYLENDDEFDTIKKVDDKNEVLKMRSPIYHQRFVFIVDKKNDSDKSIKLYDIKDKKVVKTVFAVKAYEQDYVALKNEESHYGLEKISEDAVTTTIPYEYDALGILPDQSEMKYVMVQKNNNSYLANLENKVLTKAFNNPIVGATDKYIKTKDATGKYHVYDYNAKEVNEATQEFVVLLENLMISVRSNVLYVLDYEGNMMVRNGIPLNNEFYNPQETYKDLKLIKTVKSFDYELSETVLNIYIYNTDATEKENNTINLYEGKLSSKLAYMDYYNGSIGFYSDLEKKNPLGTYTCNNRNTVEKDTTSLNNCRIATESYFHETVGNTKEVDESSKVGWIPIFGKRYAFIKDGDTIILYNIPSSEVLAKYESVDTGTYNNINEISLSDAGTIPFIAKSKSSGKFGVAKITSDGVKPVIPFEAQSIKRLGNYYVVESKEGYALYDLDGTKKTSEVVSSIVDYHNSNLKTLKDGSYYVYNFEGKGTGQGYTYVELYDSYYAAVVANKVHLFDYSGKDLFEGISEAMDAKLELKINNYYGNGTKAFRVADKTTTIEGEKYYVVEIGTVTGSYVTVNIPVDNKPIDSGDQNES